MAAEKTKSIKDFEIEKGFMILGKIDENKKVTEDEFMQLELKNGSAGVTYKDRVQYLKSKGIEVNRKNMIDSSL